MLANNGRMKIAIQRNGRLTEDSVALLRACGLSFEFQKQSLYSPCNNFDLDVLAIRDDDIPEYVQDGVADLGIIGENILQERKAKVHLLAPLGFGGCKRRNRNPGLHSSDANPEIRKQAWTCRMTAAKCKCRPGFAKRCARNPDAG